MSASTASKFAKRIRARCRAMGNLPRGGRPRGDLAPGLRTIDFERCAVIASMIEGDIVRITGCLLRRPRLRNSPWTPGTGNSRRSWLTQGWITVHFNIFTTILFYNQSLLLQLCERNQNLVLAQIDSTSPYHHPTGCRIE